MAEQSANESSLGARTWIALGIITAVALGGLIVWRVMASPRNDVRPEEAARTWGQKLELPVRGAACTMFDSDDDGYVSCVLALNGPDKVYFQGLQCGEYLSRKAGGCKPDTKNPEVHLVMEVTNKPAVAASAPAPELPR